MAIPNHFHSINHIIQLASWSMCLDAGSIHWHSLHSPTTFSTTGCIRLMNYHVCLMPGCRLWHHTAFIRSGSTASSRFNFLLCEAIFVRLLSVCPCSCSLRLTNITSIENLYSCTNFKGHAELSSNEHFTCSFCMY